jgi:hypothetical protein
VSAAKTVTPESLARLVAEHTPCDAADSYGDPCCYWCHQTTRWRVDADPRTVCDHLVTCEWVLIRRHYGLPVPAEVGAELHTCDGE